MLFMLTEIRWILQWHLATQMEEPKQSPWTEDAPQRQQPRQSSQMTSLQILECRGINKSSRAQVNFYSSSARLTVWPRVKSQARARRVLRIESSWVHCKKMRAEIEKMASTFLENINPIQKMAPELLIYIYKLSSRIWLNLSSS